MTRPNFQIQMLKIPVSDIERSSQFYADHLGFEVQFAAAEYGWAQLSAGEVSLALYQPGMGGGSGQMGGSVDFHLMLTEAPFQSLAQALLAQGLLVEDMIHTSNDGGTFIDVRDPDGNILKVMQC